MTAHQRNLSASIDPVKLDRLAEVAVKVGDADDESAGALAKPGVGVTNKCNRQHRGMFEQ